MSEDFSSRINDGSNAVMVYAENQDILAMLERLKKELGIEIIIADCDTDLIAIGYFLAVIDPEKLYAAEPTLQWLMDYVLRWDDPGEIALLFTRPLQQKLPGGINKLVIHAPDVIDEDFLRLTILKRRAVLKKRIQRNRDYDVRLFRILAMAFILKHDRHLNVQKAAEKFNVSGKTIQRDLRLLDTLGLGNIYERKEKCHVLTHDDTEQRIRQYFDL